MQPLLAIGGALLASISVLPNEPVRVTGLGQAGLRIEAEDDAIAVDIQHDTPDQMPAIRIKSSGNAWPLQVDVEPGMSNLARFTLEKSTSRAPAFLIEAETEGPAFEVVSKGPGAMFRATGTDGTLKFDIGTDFVGVGRTRRVTNQEIFGLYAETDGFTGMYVQTSEGTGDPFYGYSAGGDVDAFHYYNGEHEIFHLVAGAANRVSVRAEDGNVGLGVSTPEHPLHLASGAHVTPGGAWTNASSRSLKAAFKDVDARQVLSQVRQLDIQSWEYQLEPGVRHIGPTSEAFASAFGLGGTEQAIATVDADGVTLIAIQALGDIVERQDRELARAQTELRELRASRAREVADLEARLARLEAAIADR